MVKRHDVVKGRGAVRALVAGLGLAVLAGCDQPLDLDFRDQFGRTLDTSEAAQSPSAPRPAPDARGIISYPNYQVAVARRGDTLADVARRIGVDANALARYNGIQTGDALREGEVIALQTRVAEAAPVDGTAGPGAVDITALAGSAIESASVTTTPLAPAAAPAAPTSPEPVRHKVNRGETAFTIARLYDVSVRSLAEWNGLGSDFAIREGQFLLIPVGATAAAPVAAPVSAAAPAPASPTAVVVPKPGVGSPTPTPPSAVKPLPEEKTEPTAAPAPAPAPAQPAEPPAEITGGQLGYPVQGSIIREYAKGRNDGIDISAAAGTSVKAAANGTVAAITKNTDNVPILVIKHDGGLLTVYANVADLAVAKGDTVSRGQTIAKVRPGDPAFVHFEVRKGFDSVDPLPYLN